MKSDLNTLLLQIIEYLNSTRIASTEKNEIINIIENFTKQEPEPFEVDFASFQEIMSYAKTEYANLTFPLEIGGVRVDMADQKNYCLFLAMVVFLNKNEALKRIPNIKKGR